NIDKDSAYEIPDLNEETIIIARMTWILKIQMKPVNHSNNPALLQRNLINPAQSLMHPMHPALTNIDDVMPERTFWMYHQWSSEWTITRVAIYGINMLRIMLHMMKSV
ncbi:hypothetical protein Tco_1279918, partial [Tanacetum coccineum]